MCSSDLIRGKSDIHTKFDDVGQCKFVRYDPSVSLFNWDTDPTAPQSSNDSVILICTPENMTYVESMSLGAGDLNNSWGQTEAGQAVHRAFRGDA